MLWLTLLRQLSDTLEKRYLEKKKLVSLKPSLLKNVFDWKPGQKEQKWTLNNCNTNYSCSKSFFCPQKTWFSCHHHISSNITFSWQDPSLEHGPKVCLYRSSSWSQLPASLSICTGLCVIPQRDSAILTRFQHSCWRLLKMSLGHTINTLVTEQGSA